MKTTLEANGLFLNHIPAFIPIKMFAVDDNIVNSFKSNQSYPLQLSSLNSHNSVYLCSALLCSAGSKVARESRTAISRDAGSSAVL